MSHSTRRIVAAALALYPFTALAEDRLECVMPDGGRVLMQGSCEPLYGDSPAICDTAYRTRYVPARGGAERDLGITAMRRTEDSGSPAEMCANFYVQGQATHFGTGADGKYRILRKGNPDSYALVSAKVHHEKEVEERANRDGAKHNLSFPGFTRMGMIGRAMVVEHAMTSWHRGHYADASFYAQPLSHVSRTESLDEGKSWSAPLITTESRLFAIGRSVLDQPATAKPGASHFEPPVGTRAAARAQAPRLALRCVLPDGAAFVLSGLAGDGGAPVDKIAYFARPGALPISVEPELAMAMFIPAAPGAARTQACQGAGLANGVPYFGATLLDRDGKRFTRFSYPDKIWFPQTFNASVQAQVERQGLNYTLAVGVTRKGGVLALEFPLMRMEPACTPRRGEDKPVTCPVRAVLRSESRDDGQSWSDLALSPSSSIFSPGKAVGAKPGAARLQDDPGTP